MIPTPEEAKRMADTGEWEKLYCMLAEEVITLLQAVKIDRGVAGQIEALETFLVSAGFASYYGTAGGIRGRIFHYDQIFAMLHE